MPNNLLFYIRVSGGNLNDYGNSQRHKFEKLAAGSKTVDYQ
jgi:hypothetical protein